jgi:hypothetical protein
LLRHRPHPPSVAHSERPFFSYGPTDAEDLAAKLDLVAILGGTNFSHYLKDYAAAGR